MTKSVAHGSFEGVSHDYILIRAQREAQHALRPAQQLLRVALWLTLAAVALVGYLALTGRSAHPVLAVVAALVVPLGIADRNFERHPVSIARWTRRGIDPWPTQRADRYRRTRERYGARLDYGPKGHPLADVATRTIEQILDEARR